MKVYRENNLTLNWTVDIRTDPIIEHRRELLHLATDIDELVEEYNCLDTPYSMDLAEADLGEGELKYQSYF